MNAWDPARTIEQTWFGSRPAPELLSSFDGLGEGFTGPQGTAYCSRRPSRQRASAIGPDHIFQIVKLTRMAIYTKKGKKYDTTGTGHCFSDRKGETRVAFSKDLVDLVKN